MAESIRCGWRWCSAAPVLFDRQATVDKVCRLVGEAARQGARLILFPEALIPAYPWGLRFGTVVGGRTLPGRKAWARYWANAVEVPGPATEAIGAAAREAGAYVAIGVIERDTTYSGGTVFCTLLYFGPDGTLLGKHRKLKPTAGERYIWGEGDGSTMPVFQTGFGREGLGVLGGLICWENYMPLARMAMYAAGVDIYLAPTADSRDTWQATMRHVACEGRCFVLSCCQYVTKDMYPADLEVREELEGAPDVLSRGGSVIVSPLGNVLAGPLFDAGGHPDRRPGPGRGDAGPLRPGRDGPLCPARRLQPDGEPGAPAAGAVRGGRRQDGVGCHARSEPHEATSSRRHHRGRVRRAEGSAQPGGRAGGRAAGGPAQLPPLPAAALPGGQRRPGAGGDRPPDPRHPAAAAQRPLPADRGGRRGPGGPAGASPPRVRWPTTTWCWRPAASPSSSAWTAWTPAAFGLKDLMDAIRLRNHVLTMFEQASTEADAAARARLLTFVIVGGGRHRRGAGRGLPGAVQPRAGTGLSGAGLSPGAGDPGGGDGPAAAGAGRRSWARRPRERWRRWAWRCGSNSSIASADDRGVIFKDGSRLDCGTLVWAAGVRASPLARHAGPGCLPRRPGLRGAVAAGAGSPRGLRHRRHGLPGGARRPGLPHGRAGGHPAGRGRGAQHRAAGGRAGAAAVPVPGPRDHGHHRPAVGGGAGLWAASSAACWPGWPGSLCI